VEHAVEIFALVHWVILGVSHAAWAELFVFSEARPLWSEARPLWSILPRFSEPVVRIDCRRALSSLQRSRVSAHAFRLARDIEGRPRVLLSRRSPQKAPKSFRRDLVEFIPVGVLYLILACVVAYQILSAS